MTKAEALATTPFGLRAAVQAFLLADERIVGLTGGRVNYFWPAAEWEGAYVIHSEDVSEPGREPYGGSSSEERATYVVTAYGEGDPVLTDALDRAIRDAMRSFAGQQGPDAVEGGGPDGLSGDVLWISECKRLTGGDDADAIFLNTAGVVVPVNVQRYGVAYQPNPYPED